jgi:hypothetical protein
MAINTLGRGGGLVNLGALLIVSMKANDFCLVSTQSNFGRVMNNIRARRTDALICLETPLVMVG